MLKMLFIYLYSKTFIFYASASFPILLEKELVTEALNSKTCSTWQLRRSTVYNQHSFKVGSQNSVSEVCCWIMAVSAERYDVTIVTFHLLDITYRHLIILSYETIVWHFVRISIWVLELWLKVGLIGHTDLDLWLTKSNEFILGSD